MGRLALLLAVALVMAGCAAPSAPKVERPSFSEQGLASWYGRDHQGKPTASGEAFDRKQLTAAHRTLPLGSIVRVTTVDGARTVKVRVNDRGPFVKGRIVDLSEGAARALGMAEDGTAEVRLEMFASDQGGLASR